MGSPPVSVRVWMPHSSQPSSRSMHSSQENSPIMGELSAAIKQCLQFMLHLPVMAQFSLGK